jgi:hypothetical protein
MNPLVREKRKFNFLPYFEININATDPLWHVETMGVHIVNPGNKYFGLVSCIQADRALEPLKGDIIAIHE